MRFYNAKIIFHVTVNFKRFILLHGQKYEAIAAAVAVNVAITKKEKFIGKIIFYLRAQSIMCMLNRVKQSSVLFLLPICRHTVLCLSRSLHRSARVR